MTEGKKFKSELWSLDEAVDLFVAEDFHDGDLVSQDWLRMALEINDAAVKKTRLYWLSAWRVLEVFCWKASR